MSKARSLYGRLYDRVGGNPVAGMRGMLEPLYAVTVIDEADVSGGWLPDYPERGQWEAYLGLALGQYALPYLDGSGELRFRRARSEEFELKLANRAVAAFQHRRPDRQGNFVYVRRNSDLFVRLGGPCHRGDYPEALGLVATERRFTVFHRRIVAVPFLVPPAALDTLEKTHVEVCTVQAKDLEAVFIRMNNAPPEEARLAAREHGVHTSTSVGDVVLDRQAGTYFEVARTGFRPLRTEGAAHRFGRHSPRTALQP